MWQIKWIHSIIIFITFQTLQFYNKRQCGRASKNGPATAGRRPEFGRETEEELWEDSEKEEEIPPLRQRIGLGTFNCFCYALNETSSECEFKCLPSLNLFIRLHVSCRSWLILCFIMMWHVINNVYEYNKLLNILLLIKKFINYDWFS